MVAGVCSGAVIRKGGVHHLKPDSQAMDQCLMERVYLPTYLGVCVCVNASPFLMCMSTE